VAEDKSSTMRLKESTKVLLDPYKKVYGSYEKAVLGLIKYFEGRA